MTSSDPTISVIIPNFNYEKSLRSCLESVYGQTYPPLEVIVVDDASTDRSREVAAEFPCTVIALPVNQGVSAARNTGAARARGEILFFLDSDVALTRHSIENAVRLLKEDPARGCVHGVFAAEPLFDDGPVERYHVLHAHHWLSRAVGPVETAIFALAAIPRGVFEAVGPFDEALRDSEDVEYSERLRQQYRILLTAQVEGRHDDVSSLPELIEEKFRRSQLQVFAARHRFTRGALKVNRTPTVALAALSLPPLAGFAFYPPLAALSLGFLAAFPFSDLPLFRFIRRQAGFRFLLYFTLVHYIVQLALVAGVLAGMIKMVVVPGFGPSRAGASGGDRSPRWRKRVRLALGCAFIAAALAAAAATFRDDQLAVVGRHFMRPAVLPGAAAAVALMVAGLMLGMLAWRAILADLGSPISVRQGARTYFLSYLSKYVPGRIWGVLAYVYIGGKMGVAPGRMVASYLLSLGVILLTGLTLGLVAGAGVLHAGVAPPVIAAAVIAGLLLWPGIIGRCVDLGLRILRRPESPAAASDRGMRRCILFSVASWVVSSLHLWIICLLLDARPLPALVICLGAFPLAAILGNLVLISPDGVGPREVLLAAALHPALPLSAAVAASIASRLVSLAAELGGAGGSSLYTRLRRGMPEPYSGIVPSTASEESFAP